MRNQEPFTLPLDTQQEFVLALSVSIRFCVILLPFVLRNEEHKKSTGGASVNHNWLYEKTILFMYLALC